MIRLLIQISNAILIKLCTYIQENIDNLNIRKKVTSLENQNDNF